MGHCQKQKTPSNVDTVQMWIEEQFQKKNTDSRLESRNRNFYVSFFIICEWSYKA
jgi:hypothetical protein